MCMHLFIKSFRAFRCFNSFPKLRWMVCFVCVELSWCGGRSSHDVCTCGRLELMRYTLWITGCDVDKYYIRNSC